MAASKPTNAKPRNSRQLWQDRLDDLETIMKLRNWRTIPSRYRNDWLFILACASAWLVESKDYDECLQQLVQRFGIRCWPQTLEIAAAPAKYRAERAEAHIKAGTGIPTSVIVCSTSE